MQNRFGFVFRHARYKETSISSCNTWSWPQTSRQRITQYKM